MRFGIDEKRDYTLEELGEIFAVTRERIRQIEQRSLQILRNPNRRKPLVADSNGDGRWCGIGLIIDPEFFDLTIKVRETQPHKLRSAELIANLAQGTLDVASFVKLNRLGEIVFGTAKSRPRIAIRVSSPGKSTLRRRESSPAALPSAA